MLSLLYHATLRHLSDQIHEWDHRATAGIGLGFAIMPSLDVLMRLLGVFVMLAGLYFSWCREQRERRAEQRRNEGSRP